MSSHINEKEILHQAALLAADLYADHMLSRASSLSKTSHKGIDSRDFRQSVTSVKKEFEKNVQARKAICTALGSVKNDIREVTKVVVAALLPLSLS